MSDLPPRTHNLPPLSELVSPDVVDSLIAAELDHIPEPGTPSIRQRDQELVASCKRFLAAFPKIETPEAEVVATELLSACQRYAGDKGRVESARKALKQPVWDAGVSIDRAFGKYGTQLGVRSLTGPVRDRRSPPYTLAEQVTMALAAYKDAVARKIREEEQAKADRLAGAARLAERLGLFGEAADAAESAEVHQAAADMRMADLTRSKGNDVGMSSGRMVRVATIIDPAAVPRQFCVPSQSLVDAAKGQPGTPIPTIAGCTIEDVPDLTVRK